MARRTGKPEEEHATALRAFVEQRLTTCVRDVIGADNASLRVLEVKRTGDDVVSRWLAEADAARILKDIDALTAKHSSYVSFSWDEVDSLFTTSPGLSIVRDGEQRKLALPGQEQTIDVADLSEFYLSSKRHPGLTATRAMLALAKKHRLIVHCA